jgi:hypothetical protein
MKAAVSKMPLVAAKAKANDKRGCPVLEFRKDTGNGEITILTEVHVKGSYLSVFDAWRKNKARRHATALWPSVNVQNEAPHA